MGDLLAPGRPAIVEALRQFEAVGFAKEAAQALLPEVARSFLAARLADAPPDIPTLVEAIFEAQAEGVEQVTETRAQLPILVRTISPVFSISP